MALKIVTENRKARHDYTVIEVFEAGIVLQGTEVKAIRQGKINLKEGYAVIEKNEVYLHNCHINPYTHGNINNHDPLRKRKLLLRKREILKIIKGTTEKGLTIVPLKVYFKDGKVKVEISVAKGKRLYDKRDDMKKRSADMDIRKALKVKNE
jgi:SsrA-binding protein